MLEGLRRHVQVAREAWTQDRAGGKDKVRRRETDFLPAALEVLETPPNPVGRTLVWLLVAFFTIAMGWSWFSHIDVVATAPGKTLPRDRVKQVQAAEPGVVREIYVENGQRVIAGDILIALDPTVAAADADQARQGLLTAETALAQANALVAFSRDRMYQYVPPEGLAAREQMVQRQLIASRVAEYEATALSLSRQREEAIAERDSVIGELEKLQQTLPLVEEQLAAREELLAKGLSAKLLVLELRERVIAHSTNIDIQSDQLTKMKASLAAIDARAEQYRQEFRKMVVGELAEAQDEVTLRRAELEKALRRNALQELRAPASGTVQQLAVHTIGGVIQAAEPLLIVVPDNGDLMVEAMVLNRDIGSIEVGDEVEVKLEAFPFTKHGVVHGRLENLSLDAIEDENLGLVYAARVSLDRDTIMVNDREVRLTSGMAITAEIKVGKRRLIEFILSPLLRYRDEALRER